LPGTLILTTSPQVIDELLARGEARKGGRPACTTQVMVRILILKNLYKLSGEQMEYQLPDRMSYQRFCLPTDRANTTVAMPLMAACYNRKRLATFLDDGVDAFCENKPSKTEVPLQGASAWGMGRKTAPKRTKWLKKTSKPAFFNPPQPGWRPKRRFLEVPGS
jgi:hypothetical protein